MYYSSDEQDTPDMTGKAFESHLKEKDTAKKTKEGNDKEGNTAKKTKSKGFDRLKDWTDEEISLLIDMLEEKPCLWDVFDKQYTKRDVKEIAYTEIASSLDTNIESIKGKINGLRAQLGKEVAKVNKTKGGHSTDELYASSWIHYDRLSFLLPVIKSSKSRDTLKRKNEEENEEVEETMFSTLGLEKKTIAERKIELLSKCTEAITKKPVESADSKRSTFALYVNEKLSQLGKRDRRIAEKRISDVLFEVEMQSEREEPVNRQMVYGSYGNNSYRNVNTTPLQGQSYMEMLEHVYMRPEVNSNRFEISLRGKISLRCKVTSLFVFT